MKITLVSFTINGGKICALLQEELNRQGHNAVGYCKYETAGINIITCLNKLKSIATFAFPVD